MRENLPQELLFIFPNLNILSDTSVPEFEDNSDDDPDYEPDKEEADTETIEDVTSEIDTSETETQMNVSDLCGHTRTTGCDDTNVFVEKSRGKGGDKKGNFCLYCKTIQQKIARHLETRHKDVEDVKKFIDLPKGNPERKNLIAEIRKRGNFLFNTDKNYNNGELKVARRPQEKFNRRATDFRACAKCKAFFSNATLRIHFKRCTGLSSHSKRHVVLLSKRVTSRLHPVASDIVKNQLFPPLREDDIVRKIRYDSLIILYANKMVQKYRNPRHFDMIRQRIRLLGRFLQTVKSIDQRITDMSSLFDPRCCDATLDAIKKVAKFNSETCSYETPTVAFSLGTLLKQIGNIFLTECIKEHSEEKRKNTKNFLKLFTQEINININRTVSESQLQMKRRKYTLLPNTEDIKLLHSYLNQKRKEAFDSLQERFSQKSWTDLAESVLISIQLFNRRRPGEVERILIEDFKNFKTISDDTDKESFNSLSERSKLIAGKYVRFEIRGKLNRTVPVLLDNRMVENVQLLIKLRSRTGVAENNPYLFGISGIGKKEHKYMRACNLIRKFSEECGAQHPERLRGTKLRKHIATKCIALNLEEQEVEDLANFMGHAEKIHKHIYRQPIISRDILRMSKLLEIAQGHVSDDSDSEENIENDPPSQNFQASTKNNPPIKTPQKRSSKYIKRMLWSQNFK